MKEVIPDNDQEKTSYSPLDNKVNNEIYDKSNKLLVDNTLQAEFTKAMTGIKNKFTIQILGIVLIILFAVACFLLVWFDRDNENARFFLNLSNSAIMLILGYLFGIRNNR